MALVARVLVAINAALAHPRLSLPAGNDVALHLASAVGAQNNPRKRVAALSSGVVRVAPARRTVKAWPRS
jgi:hypothetical protein